MPLLEDYPLLLLILLIAEAFWLTALIQHLKDDQMKDVDKICWTIVLCTLNLLGLGLYMFLKLKGDDLSEEAIKRAANEGRL